MSFRGRCNLQYQRIDGKFSKFKKFNGSAEQFLSMYNVRTSAEHVKVSYALRTNSLSKYNNKRSLKSGCDLVTSPTSFRNEVAVHNKQKI